MFAFVMKVLILLPPINAIQAAHPIHIFTIQSNPAYTSYESCNKAAEATGDYITAKMPNAKMDIQAECSISPVVEG